MKHLLPIRSLIIPFALVGYLTFTLLAYSQYPAPFSPMKNWLSDLGDVRLNSHGALFYNLGILLTGILVLWFFVEMSRWKMENRKIQNIMVGITQVFGILGCVAMLMSAVYPISVPQQHRFFSVSLYIFLGTAFMFSVAALRYQPKIPKWVLILGILTGLVDIFSGIYHETTLLEWVTVTLFLTYLLALSIKTEPAFAKPSNCVWKGQDVGEIS